MLDLIIFIATLVLYEVTRNSDPGFIPKLAPGTLVRPALACRSPDSGLILNFVFPETNSNYSANM
jgi:hypothetical protein